VFGVGQSLASIASIIAPLLAGLIIEHAPLEAWAMFTGGSMLFAFVFNDDTDREAEPA
jgi:hypothetical protein